ncbi:hypothetical protein CFP56_007179 [Quercus suber]|uniref:Uncharacterized protein n=1 Tax=Quercus suber TaxID=58331 RepID=A0AAW0L9F7_QUESU
MSKPRALQLLAGEQMWKNTKKIKENALTYPYVWPSYIVVYGGFALWTTYYC